MSQFDFPRVHFTGQTVMDPGTGNNSFFQPVVYYDPLKAQAILPPRLYISERGLMPNVTLNDVMTALPENTPILEDDRGDQYIEIKGVSEREVFHEWATTPLGQHSSDDELHHLYPKLKAHRSPNSIIGQLPGYWNYFGDMTFDFQDTIVTGIDTCDSGLKKSFTHDSIAIPREIKLLLGSDVKMKNRGNKPSAVMIDVLPTMALYSQVFCDNFSVDSHGVEWFAGKPTKASLRFLNLRRIINQPGIVGASGAFYSVIPIEALSKKDDSPLVDFFIQNRVSEKKIKGIMIRYEVMEVMEDRMPDYRSARRFRNPARGTVVGTISPWMEGDLKTITRGRLLTPHDDLSPQRPLGAVLAHIDENKHTLSLDMLTSMPEVNLDVDDNNLSPTHFPQQYKLANLGVLKIALVAGDKNWNIGEIDTSASTFSREQFFNSGGIIDFSLKEQWSSIKDHLHESSLRISTQAADKDGKIEKKLLLTEEEYFVTTEAPGLYIEASEDPTDGFRSESYLREPCELIILSKGKPIGHPIDLHVIEYDITPSGMKVKEVDLSPREDGTYIGGDQIKFPFDKASNKIFYFSSSFPFKALKDPQNEIVKTGAFISLRVLPSHDYGAYTNTGHKDFPMIPPYDFIYKEIFQLYDYVYPISADISPLSEEGLRRASDIVIKLMSPENWSSNLYMPSTREMSQGQHRLLLAFLQRLGD